MPKGDLPDEEPTPFEAAYDPGKGTAEDMAEWNASNVGFRNPYSVLGDPSPTDAPAIAAPSPEEYRDSDLRRHLGQVAFQGYSTVEDAPRPSGFRERRRDRKIEKRAVKKLEADIYTRRTEKIYGPKTDEMVTAAERRRKAAEIRSQYNQGGLTARERNERLAEIAAEPTDHGEQSRKIFGRQQRRAEGRLEDAVFGARHAIRRRGRAVIAAAGDIVDPDPASRQDRQATRRADQEEARRQRLGLAPQYAPAAAPEHSVTELTRPNDITMDNIWEGLLNYVAGTDRTDAPNTARSAMTQAEIEDYLMARKDIRGWMTRKQDVNYATLSSAEKAEIDKAARGYVRQEARQYFVRLQSEGIVADTFDTKKGWKVIADHARIMTIKGIDKKARLDSNVPPRPLMNNGSIDSRDQRRPQDPEYERRMAIIKNPAYAHFFNPIWLEDLDGEIEDQIRKKARQERQTKYGGAPLPADEFDKLQKKVSHDVIDGLVHGISSPQLKAELIDTIDYARGQVTNKAKGRQGKPGDKQRGRTGSRPGRTP